MRTIIGSSGRNCVLFILFQLYGPNVELFEGGFFRVGQYDTGNHHTGRRTNVILTLYKS